MKLRTRYLGGSLFFCVLFLTTQFYLLSGRYQSIFRKIINIRGTYEHYSKSSNINDDLSFGNITVSITAEQFRLIPNIRTGNPLIDEYGDNDLNRLGENGRAVMSTEKEQLNISDILEKYRLNIIASDLVPLNRMVPDSRPPGCKNIIYSNDLPKTSIIIPFYDEWPSILIRTVYSIINRTPRHLLQEIILVDDYSQFVELKSLLDNYISKKFPKGLVKLIRNPTREGLIKARIKGWKQSTGR
ncbi:GALNT [Mytilus edulis]|uniref:GALNT n=1 Tax=Mytilus edulis TaxID=6550 RepID=A0A8S3R6H3_MYTED|nr:GALNT [Mytilus edulis]